MSNISDQEDFTISFKKKKNKGAGTSSKRTTSASNIEDESISSSIHAALEESRSANTDQPLTQTKRQKTESEGNVPFYMHSKADIASMLSVDQSLVAQNVESSLASEEPSQPQKSTNRMGPQRQNLTIRSTTVIDYQPDICKDYKETGVCGWGDTCKFIHDRGDFSNMPNRLTWKAQMAAKTAGSSSLKSKFSAAVAKTLDSKTLSGTGDYQHCAICLNPFPQNELNETSEKNENASETLVPVMTNCSHFFCEACLTAHLRVNSKCPVCKSETHLTFNSAEDVILRLRKADLLKSSAKKNDSNV